MPGPDPFTHTFKFQIGDDGSRFIEGRTEFNTDGKVSHNLADSSVPLQAETLQLFVDLFDLLQRIFKETGGIKLIKVKKIEE